jgi:hypothetical protein
MERRGSSEPIDHATDQMDTNGPTTCTVSQTRQGQLTRQRTVSQTRQEQLTRQRRSNQWTDHHHPHTHDFDRPGPETAVVTLV